MNHCPGIELELAAFCSGELDAAERGVVQDHLNQCADCRAELVREMNLRATLVSLPRAPAPDGLEASILAALPHGKDRFNGGKTANRRLVSMALVAAGLALVLLLPVLRSAITPEQEWTEQEIAIARQVVMFTLGLTAKVIDRTQKTAVIDVFADMLPHAIDESFKMVKPTTSGGNG